jgi:hypothetical protein
MTIALVPESPPELAHEKLHVNVIYNSRSVVTPI